MSRIPVAKAVRFNADGVQLEGLLCIPPNARAVIVFAHGSGSSRFSPRNNFVADVLRRRGFATLLFDLLTEEEDATYENRFDIELLTIRLSAATRWLLGRPDATDLRVGYFGASTGSACALRSAAELGGRIGAVVSRGGRPDLTGPALARVKAPTLLIVGGADAPVIAMNQSALDILRCQKRLEIVPGATHLFEEAGALEDVARLATDWFDQHLLR